MEVDEGEETPPISVRFVDHDGDPVLIDEDLYLDVEVEADSIAEFEQDAPGEFGGHLRGVGEGATGMSFRLMHGTVGSGRPDFVTTPVQAQVNGGWQRGARPRRPVAHGAEIAVGDRRSAWTGSTGLRPELSFDEQPQGDLASFVDSAGGNITRQTRSLLLRTLLQLLFCRTPVFPA